MRNIIISIYILTLNITAYSQDCIDVKNSDTYLFCKIININKKIITYKLLDNVDTNTYSIKKSEIENYKINCIEEYSSYLRIQDKYYNKIDSSRIGEILLRKRKKYYVANILSVENDSVFFNKYKTREIFGIPFKKVIEFRYDITDSNSTYYFIDSLDYPLYYFNTNIPGMYKLLFDNWPVDSILDRYEVNNQIDISKKKLFVTNNKRNFKLRKSRKCYLILNSDFTKLKIPNRIVTLNDSSIIIHSNRSFYNIPINQLDIIGIESFGREFLRTSLFILVLPINLIFSGTIGGSFLFLHRWYKPLEINDEWVISNEKKKTIVNTIQN